MKIIKNSLEESLSKIDDYFLAYHRTQSSNVESIADSGFEPGFGAMYGSGWYFTYDLSSQLRPNMTHYGDALIKAKVNPKNLLIFDYNVSKDLFGDKCTLADQMIDHYGIYRNISDMPLDLYKMSERLEASFKEPAISADEAYNEFVGRYVKNGRCSIKNVRGIVFTGRHDGNVLVAYSYDTCIPFEYVLTDPTSGEMTTEWLSIKNVNKVITRANMAELALEKFKGQVRRIEVDNYDISNIEKDFPWLFKASMKDAIFKIHDNLTFEWIQGTWLKGHWFGDIWNDGFWKAGVWEKGEFLNGSWKFGRFRTGVFHSGRWEDGIWGLDATWSGSASWKIGSIELGNTKVIKTTDDPNTFFSMQESDMHDFRLTDLDEKFDYRSLSDEEKDELYKNFERSYIKAVGVAWNQPQFDSRARDWVFYGEIDGGIALRKQRSGLYKLNATFGSPKTVINAFKEMMADIGNEPIWGVMTQNLAMMLEKVSNKEFKQPPKLFAKTVVPHISHIFGDVVKRVEKDGGIVIDTPAGEMTKYFIANKKYYVNLLDMAKNNPDKIPIPKPVLNTLIGLMKFFI